MRMIIYVSDITSSQIIITMILTKCKNYFERSAIQRIHYINKTTISITKEAKRRYFRNWKIPTDKNKSRIVVNTLDYHYQPNTYR